MPNSSPEPVRRRRRGQELESALLNAAWAELVEAGYAALTMESVASRAHTGVAVLYRRWANKDELVLAVFQHHRRQHPVAIPDTGCLRDDLLTVLTDMGEARAGFAAVAAASAFSGLMASTGLTPAQVRDRLLGEQPSASAHTIYQHAHDRGEIDLTRTPPAVLAMPFDLMRHDLLMDLKPPAPARVTAIVDELFLPLVQGRRAAPASGSEQRFAGPLEDDLRDHDRLG